VALGKAEGLLQQLAGDGVDVVAVHSPKYDTEADRATAEAAVRRVEVRGVAVRVCVSTLRCWVW
jgi:hypothetical protein